MNEEQTQQQLSSQEIVDNLIGELLAKPESDEELEIELFGYPADYLDAPYPSKMSLKEYRHIERQYGASITFDIFSLGDTDIHFGIVFRTKAPMLLLDFGIRMAYIPTKKLRSLLYDNADRGYVITTGKDEKFVVKLPTRLLLDNSELQ